MNKNVSISSVTSDNHSTKKNKRKKPSIAFYIDSMQKGGANRVLANLTSYFAEKNYRVILITDIKKNDATLEYFVDPRIQWEVLNVDNKNFFLSNLLRIKKMRRMLKENSINVAISFLGPPNIRLVISSIGIHFKTIISVRNDPNYEYGKSKLTRFIVGKLFSLADGCVFQTVNARDFFPKTVKNKSRVILNPVNESFYAVKRVSNSKDIITVGRLYPQKNHKLLIDAFYSINDKISDSKLVIYGEGPLRNDLQKQVKQYNLTNKVFLPGTISNVAEVLSKSSIFVLSSKYEGLPNALMEAMAVGVPVISTDCPCGGPRSLIQKSSQGLLVPCDDINALAHSIYSIYSDSKIQEEIGNNARERARAFHPSIICAEWEKYINEIFFNN